MYCERFGTEWTTKQLIRLLKAVVIASHTTGASIHQHIHVKLIFTSPFVIVTGLLQNKVMCVELPRIWRMITNYDISYWYNILCVTYNTNHDWTVTQRFRTATAVSAVDTARDRPLVISKKCHKGRHTVKTIHKVLQDEYKRWVGTGVFT